MNKKESIFLIILAILLILYSLYFAIFNKYDKACYYLLLAYGVMNMVTNQI